MNKSRKAIPARVTARWLRSKGACIDDARIVEAIYPDGFGVVTVGGVLCGDLTGLVKLYRDHQERAK